MVTKVEYSNFLIELRKFINKLAEIFIGLVQSLQISLNRLHARVVNLLRAGNFELMLLVGRFVVWCMVLHRNETNDLVVFGAIKFFQNLLIGGLIIDILGITFVFFVVHFNLSNELIETLLRERDVALVHATVEWMNRERIVFLLLEHACYGRNVTGLWDKRSIRHSIEPEFRHAGKRLKLNVCSAATVI